MQLKKHEEILFESIYSTVSENIHRLCDENNVNYIINKISKNKNFFKSISLLPYWFFNCFENKDNIDIDNELFILGKVNIQACIAYTLYDYLRDKKIEKEHINICISIANIMLQKSIKDFYALVNNDVNKVNIINNILNTMDNYYLDNKIISDIHYHFKYICDNVNKKSIGIVISPLIIIWLLGYKSDSETYTETYRFFEYYLNARQLSDDEDDMCDDMLNNIYTPATFLMKAQYGSDYIHTMIRARIDMNMRLAMDSIRNIAFFDWEKFRELYIKDC